MKELMTKAFIILFLTSIIVLILMGYLFLINLFLLGIFLGLKLYEKKNEK
jgi:hypothetical protein